MIYIKIVNEQIKHIIFGEGKVVSQEEGKISVKFTGQCETKRFIYPDVFETHLKLSNPALEIAVLEEVNCKHAQINVEKMRKQRKHEITEKLKFEAEKKLKLEAKKKKTAQKVKTA